MKQIIEQIRQDRALLFSLLVATGVGALGGVASIQGHNGGGLLLSAGAVFTLCAVTLFDRLTSSSRRQRQPMASTTQVKLTSDLSGR